MSKKSKEPNENIVFGKPKKITPYTDKKDVSLEKITPRRLNVVCKEIQKGHTDTNACYIAGVAPATLRDWLTRGERDDAAAAYKNAFLKVARARAVREASLVGELEDFGEGDWRSRAWLLERTTERYSKTSKEREGAINLDNVTDAEIGALLVELKRRGRINLVFP